MPEIFLAEAITQALTYEMGADAVFLPGTVIPDAAEALIDKIIDRRI